MTKKYEVRFQCSACLTTCTVTTDGDTPPLQPIMCPECGGPCKPVPGARFKVNGVPRGVVRK